MRCASGDEPGTFHESATWKKWVESNKLVRQAVIAMLVCLLLLWTAAIDPCMAADRKKAGQGPKAKSVKLFGSIEFKSSLKSLPQWTRVLSVADRQTRQLSKCRKSCPPAARNWQKALHMSAGESPMGKLKAINRFFNKWPYRLDIEGYGMTDYWATPEEFLKLSGDCEDYSITKYFALKQLGFSHHDMRIVVVRDRIRNIGHAVLAVYLDDTAYILDNLSNLVLTHNTYSHYVPQYSVNETNRWAHIKPVGNSKKGN